MASIFGDRISCSFKWDKAEFIDKAKHAYYGLSKVFARGHAVSFSVLSILLLLTRCHVESIILFPGDQIFSAVITGRQISKWS